MEYEDEIARSRSEIGKFNERMRSYAVEMEAKDHELMNLTELSNRRKQEVLMTQQDNDKIMNMLRNMTDQKDTIDAQKLMTEEKYMVDCPYSRKWTEKYSNYVKNVIDSGLTSKRPRSCFNKPTRKSQKARFSWKRWRKLSEIRKEYRPRLPR